MPFAVELFFDPDLDGAVRRVWAQVAKKTGIPNRMADTGNRPHISLAAFNDCKVQALIESLRALSAEAPSIEIDLNSIGTFASDEGVLFLAPVVTRGLIKIHLDCQARLKDLTEGMWPYYLPEKLAFHCTVNTGLRSEEIHQAIAAVKGLGLPKLGKAMALGLVRIPEMEFIETFKLKAG
ncbi:MAG TPA: 2'-5' RNA ligase family protein [bacterium]|nr:2'-5' RNA ligase family protein [bacterium]